MLICFDIDGTLANLDHRLGYVRTKPANWTAFNAAIPYDKPVEPVIDVLITLAQDVDNEIVIASGRNEHSRDVTEEWLSEHGIDRTVYEKLYMRKDEDYRPDTQVKREILDEIVKDFGVKPYMVFDDRPSVVKMWRDEGIYVFDCNQSGKDF